jgi:O-antigen/teichoic acid export membrane protein
VPQHQPTAQRGDVGNSLVVGASIGAWSVGAFAFYLVAGRLLGPLDYGLVAALLSVLVVGSTVFIALQWSIARLVAASTDGFTAALVVYRRAMLITLGTTAALVVAATVVTLVLDATAGPIPVAALVLTYVALASMAPLLLACGMLQGQNRYAGLAWSYAASGVLRAPLLLPLLLLPLAAVDAAMLAVTAAIVISAVWAGWLTRGALRAAGTPDRDTWSAFLKPLPAIGVGLVGIAMLTNIDVVAAKVSLGGDEAGYFGAASVVAKALLVVPQAMTIVLLPRVAEREARGQHTGSLLSGGVLVMALAGLLAMALAVPLEEPVMALAFGTAFEPAAALLIPFLGATTLLGALLILVNHHVARRDHRFVWAVGALAVLQVVLLAFFSTSAEAIIAIDAIVAGVGLVVHEVLYFSTDESMLKGAGAQLTGVLNRMRGRGRST